MCPYNRPGLDRIRRRIGAFASIRESLFYDLDRDPTLSGWTHRTPDDPGIALLEGAAILGDILTFYQELYANEAYLRTARWRESVADLVRLLGYRLSPGTGGRGVFAFEVRGDAPVTIPAGFPISAQVTGLAEQAEFQTSTQVVAYPWLSNFSLYPPMVEQQIAAGTTELELVSFLPGITLEKGDRLLVGDANDSAAPTSLANPEILVVDDVQERFGTQLITIKGKLQRTSPVARLTAYKIGRSFRHFGHSAPPTVVEISSSGTASQKEINYDRSLDDTTKATGDRVVSPEIAPEEILLEAIVDDLPLGTEVICQFTSFPTGSISYITKAVSLSTKPTTSGNTLVRTVKAIRQGSYTWGAVTGPTTILTLNGDLGSGTPSNLHSGDILYLDAGMGPDYADIRDMQFHETLSPPLQLRARVQPDTIAAGKILSFAGTEEEAATLKGRQLMLAGPADTVRLVNVQSVQTLSAEYRNVSTLRQMTLDAEVGYADFPVEEPVVTVYGNLAPATQGKAEQEVALGNGDNRLSFQTFVLPKSPLTYLLQPGSTPPESPELDIYVNNRKWKRVSSLFGAKPADEVYIVREDDEANSYVQFGDGNTGARLLSGINNVTAVFRTGTSAFGPMAEGATPQAGGRLDRLDKIELPGSITGGSQPESASNARQAAPGTVQSLSRLVSLSDFENETLILPGVSLVRASWELVDNTPAVVLTVLMDSGREAEVEQIRSIVTTANRRRGPARFPVVVIAGERLYFAVTAQVAIDQSFREDQVLTDIRVALKVAGIDPTDTSGTGQRTFGQREYASRIEGQIQAVDGVQWVRVTALQKLGHATDPTTLTIPTKAFRRARLVPASNEVLALHSHHLQLSPIASPAGEST
jgi:hypothetical protein